MDSTGEMCWGGKKPFNKCNRNSIKRPSDERKVNQWPHFFCQLITGTERRIYQSVGYGNGVTGVFFGLAAPFLHFFMINGILLFAF
jgi:hypothetical protein